MHASHKRKRSDFDFPVQALFTLLLIYLYVQMQVELPHSTRHKQKPIWSKLLQSSIDLKKPFRLLNGLCSPCTLSVVCNAVPEAGDISLPTDFYFSLLH